MAITVTQTSSRMSSSIEAPKMMLASGCAASWTMLAASLASTSDRSGPPVIESSSEWAPSTLVSSSGEADGLLGGELGAVLADAHADAEDRVAGLEHRRADVGEVEVDQAGQHHQVGDALDRLAQHVVGDPEGVGDRGAALEDLEQALVGDDDQRVDLGAEGGDALLGLGGAARALEGERLGDGADRERADVAGELGDHRSGAGAGAAAGAGGEEDHVGALEQLLDLVLLVEGGAVADARVGAGAEAAGQLGADVQRDVGVRVLQGLKVGVDRDELDARAPAPRPCG